VLLLVFMMLSSGLLGRLQVCTLNLSSGKEIDGVKFRSFYVMEDGGLYLLHSWNVVEIYQWFNARAWLIAVLSIHPMKSNRRNI
jgi:hypothetical protein